jgi:hypothetical protein
MRMVYAQWLHPYLERTSPGPADLAGDRPDADPKKDQGGEMMFYIPMNEETAKQLAKEFQGPRKPPARWKRILAACLRGFVYVIASPATLFVVVMVLLSWAFDMAEE